jgi:hypothetical protein
MDLMFTRPTSSRAAATTMLRRPWIGFLFSSPPFVRLFHSAVRFSPSAASTRSAPRVQMEPLGKARWIQWTASRSSPYLGSGPQNASKRFKDICNATASRLICRPVGTGPSGSGVPRTGPDPCPQAAEVRHIGSGPGANFSQSTYHYTPQPKYKGP